MEEKIKGYDAFCWAGFGITFIAGLLLLVAPELMARLLGVFSKDEAVKTFFIRLLGLVLLPYAVAYLIALIGENSARSLLVIATSEKFLSVFFCISAFLSHKVGVLIWGIIVLDGALVLLGIYYLINLSRWIIIEEKPASENKEPL